MFKKIISVSLAIMLVLGLASCGSEMKIAGNQSQFYTEPEVKTNLVAFPDVKVIVGNEENLFDVKSYGAVGDNKTDDTAAVNAAIEAASAVNGIVYFSNGKYLIGNVTFPANVGFAVASSSTVSVKKDAKAVINSTDLYIPKKAVLAGEGSFDLTGGVNYAYPEWFGLGGAGIAKAIIAADKVYLMKTSYSITETIVIPQSRNIEIIGSCNTSTIIRTEVYGKGEVYGFVYEYESGAASNLTLSYMRILDDSGANLVKFCGNPETKEGKLELSVMRIEGGNVTAVVKNSTGTLFEEIRTGGIKLLARFEGGVNNATFNKVLCAGNTQGMLEADGATDGVGRSENIYFHHASSVSAKGIDFTISNYDDITFFHSSGDLGAGGKNEASLRMTNVDDFEITRCWWASNAGLSYAAAAGIAKIRVGLELNNCTNGKIRGNSIVNQWIGVEMNGGSDIMIEGNTFQACGHSELTFNGAKNVTVQGNSFMAAGQFGSMSEDVKDEDGNYVIEALAKNENIVFKYNVLTGVNRADDAVKGNTAGITVTDNHQ
ncbi:MAG: right-handed parallel beta-helix repeat-containing protein [Clostridia bacterium]|nr:right-handed parallel beta-helix repeat-containing protein [Clostridia bacterium]